MIEQREHFEQEATKATEMESVLCFLGYLLLNLEAAAFCAGAADFFSSVSRAYRLRSQGSDQAGPDRVVR